ncbi:MAG: response regulator transcription factor [Thermoanaerobaculaceae bacterium]|jgi:DNA-binding NarL/FixJ family response regulator|nr:response regulator transcription factor [Thermoanaerobaculaceae bacterium]
MTTTDRVKVALVEDDRRMREAFRVLIDGSPGFACVAAYGSLEEALHVPAREAPDVVLLDIKLPGMWGSEGVDLVLKRFPGSTVLMLTAFEDETRIIESLCKGASGYILKDTPPARLLEYIREATSGGAPMSPEIARKVVTLFSTFALPQRLDCQMKPQETRLLALLADGYGYQGAAEEMGVSINTVRSHVRSIYEKLQVHSQSEAVTKALRAGLI